MFTRDLPVNSETFKGVIFELKSDENNVVQANRDGLMYPYSSYANEFVSHLIESGGDTHKLSTPKVTYYGSLPKIEGPDELPTHKEDTERLTTRSFLPEFKNSPFGNFSFVTLNYHTFEPQIECPEVKRCLLAWAAVCNWIIKKANLKVDAHYGLVFCEDTDALFTQIEGIEILAISPMKRKYDFKTGSGGLKEYPDFYNTMCSAAHEIAHIGTTMHTTRWASRFTDFLELCIKDLDSLREAFDQAIEGI